MELIRKVAQWPWKRPKLFVDRIMSQHLVWQLLIIGIGVVLFYFLCYGIASAYSYLFGGKTISGYELFSALIDTNAWSDYRKGDPWPDTISFWRIFAYLFAMTIFSGLLISILTNWFSRRIQNYKNGITTYLKKNHIVILGFDDIVPSIIQEIQNNNPDLYILIQTTLECGVVKEKLQRSGIGGFDSKIVLNYGHRTSLSDLKRLYLHKSKGIYVVGDRNNIAHDSMNFECLNHIYDILSEATNEKSFKNGDYKLPTILTCVIEDSDTLSAFQKVELFDNFRELGINPYFYNFYTEWAKQLLVNKTYGNEIFTNGNTYNRKYPNIDGTGIHENEDRYCHIVIIGVNRFGIALGTEAAKIIHFPNYENEEKKHPKTIITFIDLKADEEKNFFMTRYRYYFEIQTCRYLEVNSNSKYFDKLQWTEESLTVKQPSEDQEQNFLDVEFEFIKGDVFSLPMQHIIESWAEEDTPLSIFITFKNQQKGFALATHLPDIVFNSKQTNVFVRQNRSDYLVTLLNQTKTLKDKKEEKIARYARLFPFGMTDICCNATFPICKAQAELFAYFYRHDDIRSSVLKKDFNETNWNLLRDMAFVELNEAKPSVDEQSRYYYSVYSIPYRINSVRAMRSLAPGGRNRDYEEDFSEEEIDSIVKTEQNRWNMEKLLSGYKRATKFDVDYYTEQGQKEARRISREIRPFNIEKVSPKDREMIALIPRILRATRYNLNDGIYNNDYQLVLDEQTGFFVPQRNSR